MHCCVVLTAAAEPVPAARLAQLHEVSPTYLAKQMQSLSRAGLVRSVQGKSGGYVLARPPEEITMLDVIEAVEGSAPTFVCTEIRQRGPLACAPEACVGPCGIAPRCMRPTGPGGRPCVDRRPLPGGGRGL